MMNVFRNQTDFDEIQESYKKTVKDSAELISCSRRLTAECYERKKLKKNLEIRLESLSAEIKNMENEIEIYKRCCQIIGSVSDDITRETLDVIERTINKALAIVFKSDKREVRIKKEMHNNKYPHFKVYLMAENNEIRSFSQSGSGLAQLISFMATLCLINARGCRRLLVMDEILNGLHPEAKYAVRLLMQSADDFQFICAEYNFDIGREYAVVKNNGTASVYEVEGDRYYSRLNSELPYYVK